MMTIKFNELTFEGLRVKKYEEFPWNSRSERREFLKNLVDGQDYNREKYKTILERETKEEIHLDLSKSYFSGITGLIFLGVGVLVAAKVTFPVILVLLAIAGICAMTKHAYKSRAKVSYMGLKMTPQLINLVFDTNIKV